MNSGTLLLQCCQIGAYFPPNLATLATVSDVPVAECGVVDDEEEGGDESVKPRQQLAGRGGVLPLSQLVSQDAPGGKPFSD